MDEESENLIRFQEAIRNRDIERIRELILSGGDVNARDERGSSLLHVAAWDSSPETIIALLCQGSEEGSHGAASRSVGSCLSAHNANLSRIRETIEIQGRRAMDTLAVLLEHGADANAEDKSRCTPLHVAAAHGNLSRVILHLKKNCPDLRPNGRLVKSLVDAAGESAARLIQLLLSYRARVNVEDEDGRTPLHAAAEVASSSGNMKVLLEHGANVHAKNKDGQTAMHVVVKKARFECDNDFLQSGLRAQAEEDGQVVPVELFATSIDGAKVLLQHGADVDARDDSQNTPLHYVAENGLSGLLRVLLEHNADTNIKNEDLNTPLHLAARHGRTDLVKGLLQYGASVNARNDIGRAPLSFAACVSSLDVVRVLVEHGADVNAQDNEGHTALSTLFRVLAHIVEDFISLPVEDDSDLELQNQSTQTPVRWRLIYDMSGRCIDVPMRLRMITELFSFGADLTNARDRNGKSLYANVVGLSFESAPFKAIVINHIKKLIALGAARVVENNRPLFFHLMNPSNEIWAQSQMDGGDLGYHEKCIAEVEDLKTVRISPGVTLADVLRIGNPTTLARISRNVYFEEYAESQNLNQKFPIYSFLIKLQYQKALEMKLLCGKCEISLEILTSRKIIRECAYKILQYLSEIDLENLNEAMKNVSVD